MPKNKFAVNADGSTAMLTWGKSGVQLAVSATVPNSDPSGGRGIVPPYVEASLRKGPVDTDTEAKPEDYRHAWSEFQEAMGEGHSAGAKYWAYFDLDRNAINRLIGSLRAARDQVFGADV